MRTFLYVVLTLVGVASGWAGYVTLNNNFAEVLPGELYRSGQPTGEDIHAYAERYGIRTVINLRGARSSLAYEGEAAAAAQEGIALIDYPISARTEITEDQMRDLLALMRMAERPILIHCRSGADRTGFAVAMYLHAIAGQPKEEAAQALSLRHGHIAVPLLSKAYAMDISFARLAPVLSARN